MKMKKGLLTMLALLSMGSVFAQDFTVPDARVVTARKGVLQVKLTSETTYRDLQFDLQLPTGITLVNAAATPESPDVTNVKVGAEGHVIAYNAVEGGKVRFAIYDPTDGKTFTQDVLIEIPVQASEAFTADAQAIVSGMVASSNDVAATSNSMSGFNFNIKVNYLGDVNEDDNVNVTDILIAADYVLSNEDLTRVPEMKNLGAACIDEGDKVNVTDILGIAEIALTFGSDQTTGAKRNVVEYSEPIDATPDPE